MQRTSKLKDNFYTICAILAGLMLFGVMGTMDAEDEQAQLEHYCEMVKLHKQDLSTGWPDYDGIYSEACNYAKREMSQESFLNLVARIYAHQSR